ncbi:MAG TPA: hypothetical protein VN736_29405 [Candidatus Limnocylindrales bacterium]|nr:hypothetical protein [Candidatus Limnocylindrales bacterium]
MQKLITIALLAAAGSLAQTSPVIPLPPISGMQYGPMCKLSGTQTDGYVLKATGTNSCAWQPVLPTYTVATLPAAASCAGCVARITDGQSITDTQTGGGSTQLYAWCNGVQWVPFAQTVINATPGGGLIVTVAGSTYSVGEDPAGVPTKFANFQGTWASGTTYAQGDWVFLNGSSYFSLQAGNIGNTPLPTADTAFWARMAVKGDPGAGNFNGPNSSTAGDFVAFSDNTGQNADDRYSRTTTVNGSSTDSQIPSAHAVNTAVAAAVSGSILTVDSTNAPTNYQALNPGDNHSDKLTRGANPGSHTYTVDWTPNEVKALNLKDDFCGSIPNGDLGWWLIKYNTSTPTDNATITSPANHPCVWRITSAATSGEGARLNWDNNNGQVSNALLNLDSTSPFTRGWDSHFIFSPEAQGSGSVASSLYRVGFHNGTIGGGTPTNGAWIEADTAGTSCTVCAAIGSGVCTGAAPTVGNFVYVVRNSTTAATYCVDTGIAPSVAAWYHIEMWSSTLGTINFALGVAGASLANTASIGPSGTVTGTIPATVVRPEFTVVTRTTAAKNLDIDFFSFKGAGLTR